MKTLPSPIIKSSTVFCYRAKDSYKDGEEINGASSSFSLSLTGKDANEYIVDLLNYFDAQPDALLINACGEAGRIDLQRMENAEGSPASSADLQNWRDGKLDLWSAIYSFYPSITQGIAFEKEDCPKGANFEEAE